MDKIELHLNKIYKTLDSVISCEDKQHFNELNEEYDEVLRTKCQTIIASINENEVNVKEEEQMIGQKNEEISYELNEELESIGEIDKQINTRKSNINKKTESIKTHSMEPILKCRIDGCRQLFCTFNQLKTHKRRVDDIFQK